MRIDQDGDVILESLGEIQAWLRAGYHSDRPQCRECVKEAREMIDVLSRSDIRVRQIVFSTTCEHAL